MKGRAGCPDSAQEAGADGDGGVEGGGAEGGSEASTPGVPAHHRCDGSHAAPPKTPVQQP